MSAHPDPHPSPELLELHVRLDRLEKMLERALAPAAEQREFLSVPEAARFLGLSVSTIWKLSCSRALPSHKSGRLLRFKRSDLQEYLERRRRPSREELESRALTQALEIIDGRR